MQKQFCFFTKKWGLPRADGCSGPDVIVSLEGGGGGTFSHLRAGERPPQPSPREQLSREEGGEAADGWREEEAEGKGGRESWAARRGAGWGSHGRGPDLGAPARLRSGEEAGSFRLEEEPPAELFHPPRTRLQDALLPSLTQESSVIIRCGPDTADRWCRGGQGPALLGSRQQTVT